MALSGLQFDALKELGNVGIGNAATALSKLMNRPVALNLPDSRFVRLDEFAEVSGGVETEVCALYLQVKGDLTGETFFFFREEEALELVNMMGMSFAEMDDMAISAFKEMSNIFTGAYLNSISQMLDVTLLPDVPNYGQDMLQSLCDSILSKYGAFADEVLVIRTDIEVDGKNIAGVFLFFFDNESLEKLVNIMKEKYGVS